MVLEKFFEQIYLESIFIRFFENSEQDNLENSNLEREESALNIKGGIVTSLRRYGITIEITRQDDIKIDKYDGNFKLRTATVVK